MAEIFQRLSVSNHILERELDNQGQHAFRWRRSERLVGIVMFVLLIISSLSSLIEGYSDPIATAQQAIWIFHIVVTLRAILASANSICKEWRNRTWDELVLTGVPAWQILLGKWRAALQWASSWMVLLALLRLLFIPFFIIAFSKMCCWYCVALNTYHCGREKTISWIAWAVVLAGAMTVVFTIFEILCSTALGLAASSIVKSASLALIVATVVRFMPVLIVTAMTHDNFHTSISTLWWDRTLFTLADGGTASIIRLLMPDEFGLQERFIRSLLGLPLVTSMYLAMLLVSLSIALISMRRAGASPHGRT